ncbi:MAG: hypothetical protein SFV22_07900 [Saprospiraceae bacterium]|nr:hypothetical protein [Saprospiraceae bacterium]
MEQSQFFELVCTLSPEERDRFLSYLSSNYANNSRFRAEIPLVSQMCWEFQAAPKQVDLDKKMVFARLFPGQTYADGRVEKLLVEAQKVLRVFLLNEYYHREENDFQQSLDFAELVRKRGLAGRHQKMMAKLRKNQEETAQKGIAYYFNQMQLEEAICYVKALNNTRKDDLNIPNFLQSISNYYHILKLDKTIAYLLQKKLTTFEDQAFMKALMAGEDIFSFCLQDAYLVQVNYMVLSILKKERPDISDVQNLYDFFQKHGNKLAFADLKDLSTHLRNFCAIILNNEPDNLEIQHFLFKLQMEDLARGFLHYEGKIGAGKFRSVALLAINLKYYDWAEKFIEENKYQIRDDNDSLDVYRYIKAVFLFETGRYDECYDILPHTSPVNDIVIACKRLEIKLMYETNSDLLHYRIDAFKMFLYRTSPKIYAHNLRQQYHLFIYILQQILQCPPGNPKRIDRIIQKIKQNKTALDWAWLLQKAEALKSK